ncbi:MAG: hypothetical protein II855_04545 [Candidatus Methanomethylophilaceae archaeon]|nr:hypothetical protein [Candidatus Methanomethylophilaceae archaeon]
MSFGLLMYSNGEVFEHPTNRFVCQPDFFSDDGTIFKLCSEKTDEAYRNGRKEIVDEPIGPYYIYGLANTGCSLESALGGDKYSKDKWGREIRFFIGIVSDQELSKDALSDGDLYFAFIRLMRDHGIWGLGNSKAQDRFPIRLQDSDSLTQVLRPKFVDQSSKREMILYIDDGNMPKRICVPDSVWNLDGFQELVDIIMEPELSDGIQRYALMSPSVSAYLVALPLSALSGSDNPGNAIIGYVVKEGDLIPNDSTMIGAIREQIMNLGADPLTYKLRGKHCQITTPSKASFSKYMKKEGLNPIPVISK